MGENLDRTIEVESKMKTEFTSKYNNIDSDMSSCKIHVSNPIVKKYAGDVISIINNGNTNITGDINTATTLVQSINDIEETDQTIEDDTFNLTKGIPTSKLKDADESFFQPPENIVKGKDGKNYYVFQDGDNTYKYNIKDKKFYVNDKEFGGIIHICIPEGVSDYSKLNTITMLNGNDKYGKSEHSKTANNAEGNSIVISFQNADMAFNPSNGNADNVAAITKLVNHAANTDLSKCQNIITGGSRLGAKSLRIAAQTGDVYQTVVCVNNAILVNGENSPGDGSKESFLNLEELQGLNGKNIYFVSTRNDSNIYKDRYHNQTNDPKNIPNSYLCTGIELAIENCPDSQIYLVENTGREDFKELTGPNFHYRPDWWTVFTNDSENKYDEHPYYNNILRDLCSTLGGLK